MKSCPGLLTPLLTDTTPPDFLFSPCEIPRGSFNSLRSIVSVSRMAQVALSAVLSGQLKHMCSAFARSWVQLPVVENKERNQKKKKKMKALSFGAYGFSGNSEKRLFMFSWI